MASSRNRTRTFGSSRSSISGFEPGQGTEAHRRTSSVKKPVSKQVDFTTSTPSNRQSQQYPYQQQPYMVERSSERFQAWKFPLNASTASTCSEGAASSSSASSSDNDHSPVSDGAYSSPDSSLEYSPKGVASILHRNDNVTGKMVAIQETDDNYSSAEDTPVRPVAPSSLHRARLSLVQSQQRSTPPSTQRQQYNTLRQGHRTSPSLPYPAMMSTSYTNFHPAHLRLSQSRDPAFYRPRFTLSTIPRMLYKSARRMHPVELVFSLFFLGCIIAFLAALGGVGYRPPVEVRRHSMPLPPSSLSLEKLVVKPVEAEEASDAVFVQAPKPVAAPVEQRRERDEFIKVSDRKPVRPLRQPDVQGVPLNFAEEPAERADEQVPAYIRLAGNSNKGKGRRLDRAQADSIRQDQRNIIKDLDKIAQIRAQVQAEARQAELAEANENADSADDTTQAVTTEDEAPIPAEDVEEIPDLNEADEQAIEAAGLDGPEVDDTIVDETDEFDADEDSDADQGDEHSHGHQHAADAHNVIDYSDQDSQYADNEPEEPIHAHENADASTDEAEPEYFDPFDYQLQDEDQSQDVEGDVHRMIRRRK